MSYVRDNDDLWCGWMATERDGMCAAMREGLQWKCPFFCVEARNTKKWHCNGKPDPFRGHAQIVFFFIYLV